MQILGRRNLLFDHTFEREAFEATYDAFEPLPCIAAR